MAEGRGKYDHLATYVREQTDASSVVIIVLDGKDGPGFSVQATQPAELVKMLHSVTDDLERDMAWMKSL